MSSKINVHIIVSDHISTLRNAPTNKLSKWDLFLFFVIPVCAGVFASRYGFSFSSEAANILITALSIFAGLLINVLVLIYSIFQNIDTVKETDNETIKKRKLEERRILKELFSNISYANLIAVSTVVIIAIMQAFASESHESFSCVIVALSIHFIFTLIMILKRIHIMIRYKLDQSPCSTSSP